MEIRRELDEDGHYRSSSKEEGMGASPLTVSGIGARDMVAAVKADRKGEL